MRAVARVVATAAGLSVVRSDPPLVLRRTGPSTVHLVGGAAGPLGGDDLKLEIEVGPGAALCVRTVAASVALPGPEPSRFTVTATVAEDGTLRWLPEPVVAAGRCFHVVESTVDLAGSARLVWREELVCGRHGEEPGDLRLATRVRRSGRPLYHQELAIGPGAPGWDSPAVLGGHRAAGSLLVVDPDGPPPEPGPLGPGAAVLPLAGPTVLVSALGADARQVRRVLDGVRGA